MICGDCARADGLAAMAITATDARASFLVHCMESSLLMRCAYRAVVRSLHEYFRLEEGAHRGWTLERECPLRSRDPYAVISRPVPAKAGIGCGVWVPALRPGRRSSIHVHEQRSKPCLLRRARAGIGGERDASAAGRALADLDLLLGDLPLQRIGAHAVDADLVIIVAERQQRRGAMDEPIAVRPRLIGGAVHLADQFERGHHRPAGIGFRIDRIAFGIRL